MTPTPDTNWTRKPATRSAYYYRARWDETARCYVIWSTDFLLAGKPLLPNDIRSINPIPYRVAPELPKERIE